MHRSGFERALGRRLISRRDFAAEIGASLRARRGFAAGKLGGSEQAWLMYPVVRGKEGGGLGLRAFEVAMAHRSVRHAGVWPGEASFLTRFSELFATSLAELDAIGLFADAPEASLEILRFHSPPGSPMLFEDQEPDRSPAGRPEDCWLEHLRHRRVLLVCPFADLLRDRATRETYERVWAGVGKRWFEPASVESVELPLGFDPETQRRWGTALDLLEDVDSRVARADFDCALIAAGGLGIPLAARVKERGGVAVSLGGHLQVMFGVHGERWRSRREWAGLFNEAWTGLPERYRPDPALTGENYW